MNNPAALENFVKKYRLAVTNKSKDMRLTVEEAGEIVACIALINLHDENFQLIHNKLDTLAKTFVTTKSTQHSDTPNLDGGSFKQE